MHFDQLCQIAERHMPALIPLLERARIFVFPGRAHEITPKQYTQAEVDIMREHFFLPFQTVAVEDTATCTILWDSEKNQKGIDGTRHFLECTPLTVNIDEFDDGNVTDAERAEIEVMKRQWPGACCIAVGSTTRVETKAGQKIGLYGLVEWSMVASKKELFVKPFPPEDAGDKTAAIKAVLRNVRAAIEEVFFFNNPERFVLETRPAKLKPVKNKKGKKRLPRSHNRPIYTLLEPKEIREKLGIEGNGAERKQGPHERRRHYRTYPEDPDKWPKAHGRVIVVPAIWVGPSESVRDGKRYKVRLDL